MSNELEKISEIVAVLHKNMAEIAARVDAGEELTPAERERWHHYGRLISEKWRLEDESPASSTRPARGSSSASSDMTMWASRPARPGETIAG